MSLTNRVLIAMAGGGSGPANDSETRFNVADDPAKVGAMTTNAFPAGESSTALIFVRSGMSSAQNCSQASDVSSLES